MCFPLYLSSRILNLSLLLCTIFASIFTPSSTDRKDQQEYFFSSFDIVVDDGIIPKSFVTLKEPSLTYELVPYLMNFLFNLSTISTLGMMLFLCKNKIPCLINMLYYCLMNLRISVHTLNIYELIPNFILHMLSIFLRNK
jgi:hypothetical protein